MNIKLTRGFHTIIDDEDLVKVSGYKWRHEKSSTEYGYAVTNIPVGRKGHKKGIRRKRTVLHMHNLILPPPTGLEVDHRDGNGLNNRKSNLRHATRSQQCMNRAPQHGKSSQYKGVRFWKIKQVWQARIKISGKEIHLGYFRHEDSAARAYNRAAVEAHGEFARLNVIN